jgi:hypothetical protein
LFLFEAKQWISYAKRKEGEAKKAKRSETKEAKRKKQGEKKTTEAKRKIRKRNEAKRKMLEAKKLMRNFRLNMRNGSETNPVSLRFALKRKKI